MDHINNMQTTSLIFRLKVIMITIALFFIFVIATIFLATSSLYTYHNALMVTTITLSICFLLFVITFGLRAIRQTGHILRSLQETQRKLNATMDRSQRLHMITAAFSSALTQDQVYEIIFKHAFETLNAIAGSISLISEDKSHLELKRLEGHKEATFKKWQRYPITCDVPSAKVVRYGKPMFIKRSDLSEYKDVDEKEDVTPAIHTIACLPLVIDSEVFGVMSLSFNRNREFSSDDKDFVITLSRHCAQAIHRTILFENAQNAINVRDEFLSIASHELRTPLTPLKLQVQNLSRLMKKVSLDQIAPLRLENFIETSERQITRLSNLIDDLLDVTRITSGQLNLSKNNYSLKDIVTDVMQQYASYFNVSKSEVKLDVKKDTLGNWDKARIEQVIINLLTNAAKHAPHRPIHITVTNELNIAKILVKDEGPGIAQENFERIFDRFERIASRENVGGLGLGLYISKQIVEAHEGKIYVAESSSAGSLFTVELPGEKSL